MQSVRIAYRRQIYLLSVTSHRLVITANIHQGLKRFQSTDCAGSVFLFSNSTKGQQVSVFVDSVQRGTACMESPQSQQTSVRRAERLAGAAEL